MTIPYGSTEIFAQKLRSGLTNPKTAEGGATGVAAMRELIRCCRTDIHRRGFGLRSALRDAYFPDKVPLEVLEALNKNRNRAAQQFHVAKIGTAADTDVLTDSRFARNMNNFVSVARELEKMGRLEEAIATMLNRLKKEALERSK